MCSLAFTSLPIFTGSSDDNLFLFIVLEICRGLSIEDFAQKSDSLAEEEDDHNKKDNVKIIEKIHHNYDQLDP